MVAVSNTSPICNLSIIGRLDLLRSQFSEVLIPEAVRTELERMPIPNAKASIKSAIRDGWLRRRDVVNLQFAAALGNDLDQGEAEAITLATEIQADILLIDEKEGRNFARQAGIPVRGVLGILVRARVKGEIPSVKAEIDALRSQAGFFVSPSLEAEVMRSVGE